MIFHHVISSPRWLTFPQEVAVIDLLTFDAHPSLLGKPVSTTLTVGQNGRAHALCYWFQLQMLETSDSPIIDTGPHTDQAQHWRQAAFLLPGDAVLAQDSLRLDVFINRTVGLWMTLHSFR